VRFAFIAVEKAHPTLTRLCRCLRVTRTGFHAWQRRRCPSAGLLHHSDQGCTYASEDYQPVLSAHGVTRSMSRRGNCDDNAVMDSLFSTIKHELGERFETPAHAKTALFDYLEVFYNQRRRHSTLGDLSPAAYERAAATHVVPTIIATPPAFVGIPQSPPTSARGSWGMR
jgi:transposase InsO family protein